MLKIRETRYIRRERVFITHSEEFLDRVDELEAGTYSVPAVVLVEKDLPRYATLVLCETEDGEYVTGYSVCSKADSFSVKTGKELAVKRAESRLALKGADRIFLSEKELHLFNEGDRKQVIDYCTDFYKRSL